MPCTGLIADCIGGTTHLRGDAGRTLALHSPKTIDANGRYRNQEQGHRKSPRPAKLTLQFQSDSCSGSGTG